MNQYCYKIITDGSVVNGEKIKQQVQKIYRKKKFGDLAFTEEKLPFIVLYSAKDGQVCIKMTSRAKKNVERVEEIHKALKAVDLKILPTIKLNRPVLFELEQCAWWDEKCKITVGDNQKWSTLVHNGPYFTHIMEPYEPHGVPIIYNGEENELTPKEERIANFYARRIISEQSGNVTQKWTKDKVFNKNFWDDFKKYLTPEHKKIFKNFALMDFSVIVEKLEEMKEEDKNLSSKEKDAKKIKTAERKQDYGYAIINGIKEPVGNFTIEPAAIFYGRGNNPNRGKIKRDIEPEEVTINVQEGVKVAPPTSGGKAHKWKNVMHDHNAAWIASWKDPISNENKYVYLGAEGQLKGKSDFVKYEKARKLNKYIDRVRNRYFKDIKSKNEKQRQLGTVLYLIDHYGLRVGNEKDESETDTVGASTLRVEHVKLMPPDIVIFDFLGKDSIRYYKEIPVDKNVYDNVAEFINDKKPSDPLFNLISATDINNYLKTFDKDFSAKVFRTRLASSVMENALKKIKIKKNATQDDKKKLFTKANIEVAEILNHRRTVPPKSKDIIKKYQDELKELRKKLKGVKDEGKSTKALDTRIKKKRDQIEAKKDTLNIAITTSLTNYIDPRLVVSWMKQNELNIPKVYSAVLQRKFKWAIDTIDPDWDYDETELLPTMAKLKPAEVIAPKTPAKRVSVKKTVYKQSELESSVDNVKIIDYSEKSIVVIGDTEPFKDMLKKLGGRFNPNLTVGGEKTPGWIFGKSKLQKVQDELGIEVEEPVEAEEEAEEEQVKPNVKIINYSEKSIAVIGDTKPLSNILKELGGRFNRNLTVSEEKIPGWIFGKSKLQKVKDELGIEEEVETEEEAEEEEAVEEEEEAEAEEEEEEAVEAEEEEEEPKVKPNVKIINYSEKSIAVIGDTKPLKDTLKELGGRFNPNLTVSGKKTAGWIFGKSKLQKVKDELGIEEEDIDPKKVNIHIVDYSRENVAVIGDIKIFKKVLQELGGEFKNNLIISGKKTSGWIFDKQKVEELEDTLGVFLEKAQILTPKTVGKPAKSYEQRELLSPINDITIIDYSEKRNAVIGNIKTYKDALEKIGGQFSPGLNVFNVRTPGLTFSKDKLLQVQEILEEKTETKKHITEKPKGESWIDIMEDLETLTQKQKNIIKCFARDPKVILFLKDELTGWNANKKIFDASFLARFLTCLDAYAKSPVEQEKIYQDYQIQEYQTLADEIIQRLKPSTVPTFLFLIFILHRISTRLRETYLQKLLAHISDKDAIQTCLCDNSDDNTLVTMETIKDVKMQDLYLLPSGRCVHLDDLIKHLKTSENKIVDPTYDKLKHGNVPSLTWTNGWQLRMLLDRIQEYNPTREKEIVKEFKTVLKDMVQRIPKKTKSLIKDTYSIFYFPEKKNNKHLEEMLIKYGLAGDAKLAKEIIKKGESEELNEFRKLLGIKMGHHIMEELTPDQRDAFLFVGEFVGIGRGDWEKLKMKSFCTKTLGQILHRIANVFAGKYDL
jgi:DNA topoisomerase-1